jgi:hypothetical protein
MAGVRLLALLLGCLLPSPAAAQPWLEAYRAREFQKAATLLHEILTDFDFLMNAHDPLPSRHLALMYANGLGLPRDPITACALAQDAELAARMAPPAAPIVTVEDAARYQAGIDEAREFAALHCGALSPADLRAASHGRAGCYAFGMNEQVIAIGNQSVRIGRAGIHLAETPEDRMHGFMCAAAVGRVRPFSIEPPDNAARGIGARHFIEVVLWRGGFSPFSRARAYVATWQLYEVDARGVTWAAEETLDEVAHWPGAVVPPSFDARLTMEMVRSGHVRWRIDGAPPRRGWLLLPEESTSK